MNQPLKHLNDAIELISEMKGMLEDGRPDAPQDFIEAYEELHQHLNRALTGALVPVLQLASKKISKDVSI